jgi:hypothetical protein
MAVPSVEARTIRDQGSDGPRPGTRAGVPCLTAVRSAPTGRTVCACAGAAKVTGGAWILLPGGTSSGRRDPRGCLGSGRPTKTPLIDVEPKRSGEFEDWNTKLGLN